MTPPFDSPATLLVATVFAAYLLGSIPFGLIVTRLWGLGDVRKIGSGNIGATNVLRTGSKSAALATVLLDAGKGFLPVLLARALVGEDAAQLAALFSFLGHVFPVWLGFRGGKGVATIAGALLALAPLVGLIALATWIVTFLVARISSIAALVAGLVTPLAAFLLGLPETTAVLAVMAGMMIWKHRDNIRRLLSGKEPRTTWSRK